MARLTAQELASADRIYKHVESLIGPYYGRISNIEAFVSNNKWIMFPKNKVESLRDGVIYPLPNVFLSFDNDIITDTDGKADGYAGLTYHNVEAMGGFRYDLQFREDRMISKLKGFNDTWNIEIQTKTCTCQESPSHYDTFWKTKPSLLTAQDLRTQLRACDASILNRGDDYPGNGNPVIWSVSIIVVNKIVNTQNFDQDFKDLFHIFLRLL